MSFRDRRAGLFSRLRIQTKFALAYFVLLTLFGLTCALFFAGLERVAENRVWTAHTRAVLVEIDGLHAALLKQEGGLGNFLIKLEPSMLRLYNDGLDEYSLHYQEMKQLAADNPVQQSYVNSLEEIVLKWNQAYAQNAIELFQSAGSDTDAERAKLDQLAGRALLIEAHAKIEAMRAEEKRLLALRTETLEKSLSQVRNLSGLMFLVGLVFCAIVIWSVSIHIGQPLARLTGLMGQLAGGDTRIEVPFVGRGDEVGQIGRALESFRISTLELSDREWSKAQMSLLVKALQSVSTTQHFSQALIVQLCASLEAAFGAVFCLDEHSRKLLLSGGYSMPGGRLQNARFDVGEGPIGQVAAEGMPRMLKDLPADYFSIRSATGQMPPRLVYLLPLKGRGGEVLGVVELALLNEPAIRSEQFLAEALTFAGLNLEALLKSLDTSSLLRATQQQKEEIQASEEALRAQGEELRSTNEALRDKQQQLEDQARRLQASEEELRAQSEELRVTNAQLEEKTQELSLQKLEVENAQAALELKAVDLERASQYKSDFLANMSHELRTPLNSLLILAKGLADNEYGNLNAEQLESARIVHDSGKNLLNLINDILDLSKIEAGKMDAVLETFELKPYAASFERNFRALARERGLKLNIEIAADAPPNVNSDPARLTQILNNLLSNAFKFTHEGGITLRFGRPQPGAGLVQELTHGEALAIQVQDSGIGIPADKLERLFQAFEQGDSGTSRRYGGTGLGLSICRGLAHLLGGEISVRSQPGLGSTFTLVLPQGESRVAVVPAITAPVVPLPAERPKSIELVAELPVADDDGAAMLIVEDDNQFAEVLAGLVRARGYRVLVAHDGESAIQLAARNRLAGVLLDIGLPGMDGWQVMEWLKSQPRTQLVPVHFISGADEDARARAAGAAGFLRKPVSQEQIGSLLAALPPPSGAARRLLLIEDSADDRRQVRELLRDEKLEIVESPSGEDALKKLAERQFDLIILDLGLPGMDGFEFLAEASKRSGMPPVVIHSGRELSREEGLRLREYTDSIVMKSAPNTRRLLDEVTLFLHSIRRVAPPAAEPAPKKATAPELQGKTVLIVDDDMRNMFALSKALRGHGLKVVMAQDGPKALTQLENAPETAIVLMDIMMPGMDGYETMQRIRAQAKWQKIPMIAVTAKAMSGDREKCLAAGANDYCPKPIDVDKLVEQMRRLLT